jgi:hypothetical protein
MIGLMDFQRNAACPAPRTRKHDLPITLSPNPDWHSLSHPSSFSVEGLGYLCVCDYTRFSAELCGKCEARILVLFLDGYSAHCRAFLPSTETPSSLLGCSFGGVFHPNTLYLY